MSKNTSEIRLTQYSHGAGCGCKIAPAVLSEILHQQTAAPDFPGLLVGNQERDDAAVLDLGDGTAMISTTDFFMPIVDDPFDFGRIAAVNAISDVYAMGGHPLLAIAILGWPINQLPPEVANQVIAGGRAACADAGIPLAGGHSIDCPEPIFGLAVSGRVRIDQLKRNQGAQVGDQLFLTKPLGAGIYATAQKKGLLQPEHSHIARGSMLKLNKIGTDFAQLPGVHAMTDVTGFGLLGHLVEMCQASGVGAALAFDAVPLLESDVVRSYLAKGAVPGGTKRNWASYGEHIGLLSEEQRYLLADPQTSGGLLVAVGPEVVADVRAIGQRHGLDLVSIGEVVSATGEVLVEVN